MITLNVKTRDKKENMAKLRKSGKMPAVFYGKKDKSTPISVSLGDFLKVWKQAGESSVITLKGDMGEKDALVYDVDLDPITDVPRHADFYVFEAGHVLEVNIPIKFVGVSPAVKDLGGTLVKVLYELSISAMPKDLPKEIEVDISTLLDFKSQILAKDIKLPHGVKLIEKPDEAVVLVEEIKEVVEEVAVPVDLSAIEVEKKGKKEVEGEAGAAAPAEEKAEPKKKAPGNPTK
ncbi:MAG: 50S ribosomal protein L25 [Patescibacteria group bacterium]